MFVLLIYFYPLKVRSVTAWTITNLSPLYSPCLRYRRQLINAAGRREGRERGRKGKEVLLKMLPKKSTYDRPQLIQKKKVT